MVFPSGEILGKHVRSEFYGFSAVDIDTVKVACVTENYFVIANGGESQEPCLLGFGSDNGHSSGKEQRNGLF